MEEFGTAAVFMDVSLQAQEQGEERVAERTVDGVRSPGCSDCGFEVVNEGNSIAHKSVVNALKVVVLTAVGQLLKGGVCEGLVGEKVSNCPESHTNFEERVGGQLGFEIVGVDNYSAVLEHMLPAGT